LDAATRRYRDGIRHDRQRLRGRVGADGARRVRTRLANRPHAHRRRVARPRVVGGGVLRQATAISLTNLKTLHTRLGASSVVVVGVAGVVFVLTALLAMANGLKETLRRTGEVDRVLILGKGSHSEINGSITREQAAILVGEPGIVATRDAQNLRSAIAS